MKYVITTKYLKLNEKLMCMSHGLIDDDRLRILATDEKSNIYAFVNEADYLNALRQIKENAVSPF